MPLPNFIQARTPVVLDGDDDLMESIMSAGPGLLNPFVPVITLRGEVDDRMAAAFRVAVDKLRYQRNTEYAMIEINSVGGSLLAALEMLNTMRASGIDFITYNNSHAYSAGALILSAGAPGARFMSDLASALIHGMATGVSFQGIDEVSAQVEHDVRLNDMVLTEIARNCGMSLARLKKIIKDNGSRDLWLTPKQALEIGLIDKIDTVSIEPISGFQVVLGGKDSKKPKKPATQKA